jgi:hypothetical protein
MTGLTIRPVHMKKRRSVLASLVTNDDGSISWTRVGVGVVLAAALLGAAIVVGTWADMWAAQQALIKVDKPTYVPPTSTLPAIATSLMTLAGAWSAALLALVLAAKK